MLNLSRFSAKLLLFALICSLSAPSYGTNSNVKDLDTLAGIQIYNLPRKQHIAFFDIDGVLLSKGIKDKHNSDLLYSDTADTIRSLQNNGLLCFALTARNTKWMIDTYEDLRDYDIHFDYPNLPIDFLKPGTRYYKGIIFSPNIHDGEEKISTKLETLKSFVDHLVEVGLTVSHVSFVDNEAFHFDNDINITQPFDLYHYQRHFYPLYATQTENVPCLSNLEFHVIKLGGSGGVAVFRDPKTDQKWTIKSWARKNHGINECLAAMLYQKMGFSAPDFYLYNDLPDHIRNQINGLHEGGLYRVAKFIEGKHPSDTELATNITNAFMATALLSFWDIKPDNFILTESNELHFIDTGGALLYRALGQPKIPNAAIWTMHQISDLIILRSYEILSKYFLSINDDQIKQQISSILDHSDKILRETKEFCRAVRYNETQKLLYSLESRLQHLRFLNHYFEGVINKKADPFAFASVNDGAGTLLYTKIDNEPYILLGKRIRHNWWGNLGGKADAGETFYEAASRETREESGGHFNFQDDLLYQPSHDMIIVEDNFMLRRFRTYLQEVEEFDPDIFMNKLESGFYMEEYTQFQWFPVEQILEALKNHELYACVEEGQQTLRFDETILHPPFVQSLSQPQIMGWLINLVNGEGIAGTSTQNIYGHLELKVIDFEEEHFASQEKRLALWMSHASQNRKGNPTVTISENPSNNSKVSTASHSMLNHLDQQIQDKSFSNETSLTEKIERVVNSRSSTLHINEFQARMLEHIIEQEKTHSDKVVLYHGLEAPIWFACRVLSHIRHMLDASSVQTDVLRSLDSYFDDYQNAKDLLNFILEGNNNYSVGFKRAGISCNPALFSNLSQPTSCTLDYFFGMDNQAAPQDPIVNIIKVFFDAADISSAHLILHLRDIYSEFFGDETPGALLQIFLDPKIVNQACYIAGNMGKAVNGSNEGKTVRDSLAVLDSLRYGESMILKSLEPLQVRLLGYLTGYPAGSVVVKDYFSDGKNGIRRLDQRIQNSLNPYLYKLAYSLPEKKGIYNAQPKVVEVMSKIRDIKSFERSKLDNEVVKSLKMKNYIKFIQLALEQPIDLNMTYTDPDSLETIRLGDQGAFVTIVNSVTSFQQDDTFDKRLKKSFLSAVSQLISYNMRDLEVAGIVRVLASVDAEEWESLVSNTKLIHDRVGGEGIIIIIKALASVNMKERQGLGSATIQLINNTLGVWKIVDIINALASIDAAEREDLVSAAAQLIHDKMNEKDIVSIINVLASVNVKERQGLATAVSQLIHDKMNEKDIVSIINVLASVNVKERQGLATAASQLIHDKMGEKYIVSIINGLVQIDAGEREDLASAVVQLIHNNMGGYTIVAIIKTLSLVETEGRRNVASIATKLINDKMDGYMDGARSRYDYMDGVRYDYGVEKVIEALASVGMEERESVASAAAQLIHDKVSGDEVAKVIEALAQIKVKEERESVVFAAGQLIHDKMIVYEVAKVIEVLAQIKAKEERESVVFAAGQLIHYEKATNGAEWIIRALASVDAEEREDIVSIASQLIHDKICSVSSIVWALVSVDAQKRKTIVPLVFEIISGATPSDMDGHGIAEIIEALAQIKQ
jgi:8-oxo-dGTP pyrophosphatase MutT (NUDIX family)